MRDVVTELVHLLFTLPFYAVVALGAASIHAFRRGKGSPLFRWRFGLAGAAGLLFALSVPIVPNAIVEHVEDQTKLPSEVELQRLAARGDAQILVLSGGWFRRNQGEFEVQMGSNSWERTWAAVGLWRKIGGTLIFSGAPLPDHSDSVADHMAELARQLGVAPSQVRVERLSENTHENIELSDAQFRLGDGSRPVVLVSSALHLPRSVAIARRLGLSVLPFPCDYRAEREVHWRMWLPGNDGPGNLEEAFHEMIGLLYYRLRGWA